MTAETAAVAALLYCVATRFARSFFYLWMGKILVESLAWAPKPIIGAILSVYRFPRYY